MIATFLLLAAETMTFTADRIAADNVTHALVATGHIVAVSKPLTIRGEYLTRDADGLMLFQDPVCATTCSNAVGHTHWNVTGEVEYKEHDYVILRNAWLNFYEIPILWLPYLYYPLETDCGFSWMPGYTGRWGAYLLTRYQYHLLGDVAHGADSSWLTGATRFDLRYRQGVALGEDFEWNLGEFGRGRFNVYYAWDEDADHYDAGTLAAYSDKYHSYNWNSPVERDRYAIGLFHRWDATERDSVYIRGSVFSDSSVRSDFFRQTMFNWKSQWLGYDNSGLFWEHLENAFAVGAEVSGRLNKFYGMTGRLPEAYLDVNPQPIFGLPINYESENRIGYLTRDAAEYGLGDRASVYTFHPGPWADYATFRFDTYHRLTAPFKVFDDVLSIVPRVGYHGTYWGESGKDNLTGWGESKDAGSAFRSILEGGATFAGRGTAWIDEKWRHMAEPYVDVLVQQAWLSGVGDGNRPYVFDNLDASIIWEDQFAGRARNLPYTYYGVTPGIRNGWDKLDDRGNSHQIIDVDLYAALQFNTTSYDSDTSAGRIDDHKLAEVGRPNYGKHDCVIVPGFRLRWTPDEDIMFMGRAEYDSDNNRISTADVGWRQKLSDTFKYDAKYALRDYRLWDFASTPYAAEQMTSDEFNAARFHFVQLGLEHQPIDWFAWGPYFRWDIRDNELDGVGAWFDYLTDCLGFRFLVEYNSPYTCIDGYERGEDWSFGFYIYLRAFGPDSGSTFFN